MARTRTRLLAASLGMQLFGCAPSGAARPAADEDRARLSSAFAARDAAVAASASSGSGALHGLDGSAAAASGAGASGARPEAGAHGGHDAGGDDSGTASPPPVTCTGRPHAAYLADPRMCLSVFASGLSGPRQMAFARNGDLFVSDDRVLVLWDANGDGSSDAAERAEFGFADGLSHGLAFDREQRFVYASSPAAVYRFSYSPGQRRASSAAELVISGMPTGGHATRSLVFDSAGRLYVSVGSEGNVDASEELLRTRSQIRRFDLARDLPAEGLAYDSGEVVASGMRNEVGLFIDAQDRLWGVENERDQLHQDALGGDIHNDNPAEEINLIDGRGPSFYGYPFCYSEYRLAGGQGPGTQWADRRLAASVRKSDSWCRDAANVRAPVFALQAHYAPLGIVQYTGRALPMASDFIITAHGSWNRNPAVGRLLLRATYDGAGISAVQPIVGGHNDRGGLEEGGWDARPVDVQQGPDHAVYFSDDAGGRIFKLGYRTD